MRHDTYATVLMYLLQGPATVKELSVRTGLSRNTVMAALEKAGAWSDPAEYPARWSLPDEVANVIAAPGVPTVTDAADLVTVELQKATIPAFETARQKIGEGIGAYAVDRKTDPRKLAERYALAASVFASMAHAIQQRQDDPSWYADLGGQ